MLQQPYRLVWNTNIPSPKAWHYNNNNNNNNKPPTRLKIQGLSSLYWRYTGNSLINISQAKRYADSLENAVWTNQFDNTANRKAHIETTGPEIWEQTGKCHKECIATVSKHPISELANYKRSCCCLHSKHQSEADTEPPISLKYKSWKYHVLPSIYSYWTVVSVFH